MLESAISRRRVLASAFLTLPALRRLHAQQKDTTFSADVNVVNVFATVRDKQGHIQGNLTKDDFVLEEDGRPQTIRYFSRESNLPLTLGLLVDTSMSQRRVLGEERSASYRFLDQVLREEKDMAFVIHFDREVELLQDLTSSRKQLEKALSQLELPEQQRPQNGGMGGRGRGGYPRGGGGYPGGGRRRGGGGTSLYDSVLLASDELMQKQHGRKSLIMLSDGVDNGSIEPIERAIEAAQRADTLVYSILFADPDAYWFSGGTRGGTRGGRPGGNRPVAHSYPDGKKVLERLSKETGGGFFEVSKKHSIQEIYAQIEEELRNQYSMGYTPEPADATGGYHKIRLTAKAKGSSVQTRDGYYTRAGGL